MKSLILLTLLLSHLTVFAEDKKNASPQQPPPVMVKDAKKACKDSGKEGAELLKCIKEKKGTE